MPLQQVNLHDKNEFKATPEEMRTIAEKMKDPEFAKLWADYMRDLQDPAYRAEEEAYLRQVEQEARDGGDTSFDFIFPKPGFVVELLQADGKSFVNMCQSDKVDEYTEQTTGDRNASKWLVPVSVGKPRNEDHDGRDVVVFDAVFHPKTLALADRSDRFMCFLVEIAIENINAGYQKDFGFEFRRHSKPAAIGTPANQTVKREKGKPSPFAPSLEPVSERPTRSSAQQAASATSKPAVAPAAAPAPAAAATKTAATAGPVAAPAATLPEFSVVHRGEIDLTDAWNWKVSDKRIGVPKELVVRMTFPGVASAAHLDIDVSGTHVVINKSASHKFHGAIVLPFSVSDTPISAKFDKSKHVLTLTLRVLPPPAPPTLPTEPRAEPPSPEEAPAAAAAAAVAEPPQRRRDENATEESSGVGAPTAAVAAAAAPPTAPPTALAAEEPNDRYRQMMAKIEETRRAREAAEKEEEEAEKQQLQEPAAAAAASEEKVVEKLPAGANDAPDAAASTGGGDEPIEVIDLRERQRKWLEDVKQTSTAAKGSDDTVAEDLQAAVAAAASRVLVDPALREEEEQRDAEVKAKLKEARRRQEREKEAERLEALTRAKMAELPLNSKLIFEIE